MAVDDTLDVFIALVDFAVDEALRISLERIRVHRTSIADVVFFEVLAAGDESWSEGFGDEEGLWVLRVADGNVASSRLEYEPSLSETDIMLRHDVSEMSYTHHTNPYATSGRSVGSF